MNNNERTTMTPVQKIKWLVLAKAAKWCKEEPPPYPCANVDDLYDAADKDGAMQDARDDVRCSGEETGLEAEWSRHYESNAVATQLPDGTWVGWTYWYGGGKHGQPESIQWMEHAYDVTAREETRVVRVFSREGAESGGEDEAMTAQDYLDGVERHYLGDASFVSALVLSPRDGAYVGVARMLNGDVLHRTAEYATNEDAARELARMAGVL